MRGSVAQLNTVQIYVLVLPQMLMLDMVGPAEVFNFVNRYRADCFSLKFIGPQSPIITGMGLTLEVAPLPEKIETSSWLLVPGLQGHSLDFTTAEMKRTIEWLNCYRQFEKVISVCSGALLLGRTAALDERSCTTHHSHLDELEALVPHANVLRDRLFVEDNNIYTSAGVTAGIDLALYIVERHCGGQCAAAIARNLVLFSRRGSKEPAKSVWLECRNHIDLRVHRVQDAIQAEPAKEWKGAELSEVAGCTFRHLTRIFKNNSGINITSYIHKLRIALALQLLQQSEQTVEQVAQRVGFDDVRQFRRVWKRYQSLSPSDSRRKANSL